MKKLSFCEWRCKIKDFYIHDRKWVLIADLHLNKDNYSLKEEGFLIELMQLPLDYGIIVVGDFLSSRFSLNDCFVYHSLLMKELFKHKVVFLTGNNDPFISNYQRAVFDEYRGEKVIIEHGDRRPRIINAFLNLFKTSNTQRKENQKCLKKAAKKLNSFKDGKHIIAHYHTTVATAKGVSIADWKLYFIDELIKPVSNPLFREMKNYD